MCCCFGQSSSSGDEEEFTVIDPSGKTMDVSHAHLEEIPVVVFAKVITTKQSNHCQ
jgi:hypothetical protein